MQTPMTPAFREAKIITRAKVIDKALDKESNPRYCADCESAAF